MRLRAPFISKFKLVESPEINIPVKKSGPLRRIAKFLMWLLITSLVLIVAAAGLVFYYEDEVKSIVIKELNKNLKSEVTVDPRNIDLTIIKTFPECALDFKEVLIREALKKKERDTLLYAGKISLLFNVKDLWNKNYSIKKISISSGTCKIHISKNGEPNYLFWKSTPDSEKDSLSFALNDIEVKDVKLFYRNAKEKVKTLLYVKNSSFSGDFSDVQYTLQTAGQAELSYLQLNKNEILKNKKVKYELSCAVNNDNYSIDKAELALNEIYFLVSGNFRMKDSLQSLDLDFTGKNIDIGAVLSLLPEKHTEHVKDYSSDGNFFSKGHIKYTNGSPLAVKADFGIKNATVTYKPNNKQLEKLNLDGVLNYNSKSSVLKLKNITAVLGGSAFSGECVINDFSNPYLALSAHINTSLEELNAFWPMDTLEHVSGNIKLNADIEGLISEFRQSAFSPNIKSKGSAEFTQLKAKFKGKQNEINIPEGLLSLDNRDITVSNFNLITGQSDIRLDGKCPEFLNYLFDSKKPLVINAALQSKSIALEDILFGGNTNSETQKVNIPENLVFNLKCDIKKLSFEKFGAEELLGEIDIKNQKVAVKDLSLNTMDGKARLNAVANAAGEAIQITGIADLSSINISKLFYQCNNFGQNTLNDKHLKGFATAGIDFSGEWSKSLDANLKTIVSSAILTIERGELMDFKPLESLSKYIDVQELRDIKFSTLQSSISIKNEVITIPKTSIKNSAMNIDLWGTHSFRNEIDYHIQLLLSELIANKKRANKQLDEELSLVENDPENRRSVFIRMTGTVDNPIIKYDRKGLKQKIGEDIKAEKQNMKQILKEEFGLFKKDSSLKQTQQIKADQKFNIEFGDKKEARKPNNLQPKKKEEDDDDF